METSKLISYLNMALVEAAKQHSPQDQAAAKRLIRRLQRSMDDNSEPDMGGILEELGFPDPDDIPMDALEEQEWDNDRYEVFEAWLRDELQHTEKVTRTQQALESKFGFRGDILRKFRVRIDRLPRSFYRVDKAPYPLEGKPEITFTRNQ